MTAIIVILAIAGIAWFAYSHSKKVAAERELERQRQELATRSSQPTSYGHNDTLKQIRAFQMSPDERAAEARRRSGR